MIPNGLLADETIQAERQRRMITLAVETVGLNAAAKMPVLFLFTLPEPRIAERMRLELFRQGLDNDMIMRVKP